MMRPGRWNQRRTAGFLLVVGFGFLMVAAALFTSGTNGSTALPEWQSVALAVGLVVTLLGLATFELILWDADERVLGRLGTIAFLVGSVLWIVADAFALRGMPWVFELERNYVLLASFAATAYGWAILRTGVLPHWLGWAAISWGILWAALYLGRLVMAPLGPNLITFLFGLLLLLRSAPRPSSKSGQESG